MSTEDNTPVDTKLIGREKRIMEEVLKNLPYPLDKDEIVKQAQQAGTNPQILRSIKQRLPDQTFGSAEDVKKSLG